MGQYRPMFNIALEHDFFRGGKFPGISLKPTAESQKLMHNANLVTRARHDGLTIFYDADYLDTLKLYAEDADEPLKLNFECDAEEQNFHNFTNASLFSVNKTLFFDSNNTDSSFIGKKYLHKHEYASSDDLVENFSVPTALREQHDSVMKFSADRALLFTPDQTKENPVGKVPLDPADVEQCQSIAKGIANHSSMQSSKQPSVGLISIQVSSGELDELSSGSLTTYNDYHIKFQARETHWKYFLVGEANREGAFIKDVKSEIEFDDLGEEQLADGRFAHVFLSRQAMPLVERAKPKFQLQIMKNNRPKVLVSRLPVASSKRINRVLVDQQELFVSEIYVNF